MAAFLARLDDKVDANPHAQTAPPDRNVVSAGSIVPASLITGLNSDVPGIATARVTQNVYDRASGSNLLIP